MSHMTMIWHTTFAKNGSCSSSFFALHFALNKLAPPSCPGGPQAWSHYDLTSACCCEPMARGSSSSQNGLPRGALRCEVMMGFTGPLSGLLRDDGVCSLQPAA